MKNLPKISDAEWSVMEILWEQSPLSSSEIVDKLAITKEWKPKTIHTLIGRLVKKEAVGTIKYKNYYKYVPKVAEDEMRKAETKSFIKKIYNGSVNLFISNFFKEEKLTEDEAAELKKILDQNVK